MAALAPLAGIRGWKGLVSGAKQMNAVATAKGARAALEALDDPRALDGDPQSNMDRKT